MGEGKIKAQSDTALCYTMLWYNTRISNGLSFTVFSNVHESQQKQHVVLRFINKDFFIKYFCVSNLPKYIRMKNRRKIIAVQIFYTVHGAQGTACTPHLSDFP
jgi:hypothetical protein